jgi:DNA uptake protein ComE-like DNA-binding protein
MGLKEHIEVWLSFSKKERYGIYLILFVYAMMWFIPFTFTREKVPEDILEVLPLDSMASRGGLVLGDSLRNSRPLSNSQWHQRDEEHYSSGRLPPSAAGSFSGGPPRAAIGSSAPSSFTSPRRSPPRANLLDLNLADSVALERLPGIGEKLSSRIVRYRDRLGGFVRMQQLEEVYGLHDSTLALILPYLRIDPAFVPQKLHINRVDLDVLGRHPYAGYALAKMLLAYRKQHGKFESIDMLINAAMGDASKIEKLVPYCSFED